MFLIASTGRCGTMGLCSGLNRFSDHTVEHEPAPLLLEEAHRRHTGRWPWTATSVRKVASLRVRQHQPYGQSLRCAPLLETIMRRAPQARLIVLCRRPDDYVRSAHSRGVMRRGDDYDRWRVLAEDLPAKSAEDNIGRHYVAVNRYLKACRDRFPDRTIVCDVRDLSARVETMAQFAGIAITDPAGLAAHLSSRPNAGGVGEWRDDVAERPNDVVAATMQQVWIGLRRLQT